MAEITQQREAVRNCDRKRGARRVGRAALAVVTTALAIVTGANTVGYLPFTTAHPSLSPEERHRELRQALNFAVRQVEAYRNARGILPASLAEIGGPVDDAWRFEVIGEDRYRIAIAKGRARVAFDSTQDPAVVFADLRRQ